MENKDKKEVKNISDLEIALKEQNYRKLKIELEKLQEENSKQKEDDKKVLETKEFFKSLGYDIE